MLDRGDVGQHAGGRLKDEFCDVQVFVVLHNFEETHTREWLEV